MAYVCVSSHRNKVLHHKKYFTDLPYTKKELDSGLVNKALNGFKTMSTCTTNQKTQIITPSLQKASKHFGSKIAIVIIIIHKFKT